MEKLAIGTAQFGLDYGITNVTGKVKFSNVVEILDYAFINNIKVLDTANIYGDSEEVLGRYGVQGFDVISKLPIMPKNISNVANWANAKFSLSLNRMNSNRIYGLLIHSSEELLGKFGLELYRTLLQFKKKGLVKKIGVSIYNPEELEQLEKKGIILDIVQAPFNIFDRRLESSGWLYKLNNNGVEVHIRSVFLQGLLLQKKHQRSRYFKRWDNFFSRFDEWVNDTDQTALSAALNFPVNFIEISKVIVGVQTKDQLNEIICSFKEYDYFNIPESLSIEDPMLLNPSKWKL